MKGILALAALLLMAAVPPTTAAPRAAGDLDGLWAQYQQKQAGRDPAAAFPFEACFREAAREQALPLTLLLAVARGESNFDPNARSDKECYGIMQILWPGTAKHLGILKKQELLEPCTNIRAGARYLRELLDRYRGNLQLALSAYYYGPTRIAPDAEPHALPEEARWYSAYIHHHLSRILAGQIGASEGGGPEPALNGRVPLIAFNRPYRALGFLQYLEKKAPSLRTDLVKTPNGRFEVVLLCGGNADCGAGIGVLERLGLRVERKAT